jgi:hypothetical protein
MRRLTRCTTWAARVSAVAALATGCFTAELDPDRGGVFACDSDTDCPQGHACINAVCENEAAPVVSILAPEPLFPFPHDDPNAPTISVRFSVSASNLALVDPSSKADHVFGEGHVRVELDGEELMTIIDGDISAGIEQMIAVTNTPGGHRMAAIILRNDGRPYEHEKGRENLLFWIDDGTPLVAITQPWPDTDFPLESTGPVLVAIETLNFDLSDPSNRPKEAQKGHAHVHYDADLAGCFEPVTLGCDQGYRQFIGGRTDACTMTSGAGSCTELRDGLPNSQEANVALSVSLRHHDHDPYYDPFTIDEGDTDGDTEGDTGMDDNPALVVDEIMINRVRSP